MRIHELGLEWTMLFSLPIFLRHKAVIYSQSDSIKIYPWENENALLKYEQLNFNADKITSDIDVILVSSYINLEENVELLRAKELKIPIYYTHNFIYELTKQQTRVIILDFEKNEKAAAITHNAVRNTKGHIDAIIPAYENFDGVYGKKDYESEFFLYARYPRYKWLRNFLPRIGDLQPNIVLLQSVGFDALETPEEVGIRRHELALFIEKITLGGILIYNEEDTNIREVVSESEHPIRKIPYKAHAHSTHNGKYRLETPDGAMPIFVQERKELLYIEGSKWLCQNMGVDEVDFYDSLLSLNIRI